jgi:hypothetical protein
MTKPTELDLHDFDKYTNCTFIHGCYIPDKICDDLVHYFDEHPDRQVTGKILDADDNLAVDNSRKKSTDIGFDVNLDYYDNQLLSEYLVYLNLCIKEYEYKYERAGLMASYGLTEGLNLQKYKPGEGYKNWHCERNGVKDQTRCLVFMTYLNDVPDGGTEFLYQQMCSPAKKGLTLIWPSDWMHTHRGQISPTTTKYILTGWLNYTK